MSTDVYGIFLQTLVNLQNENTLLKKQVESNKIQNVSLAVARLVDEWLNRPYLGTNERQDIEEFSREITTFIYYEMKI